MRLAFLRNITVEPIVPFLEEDGDAVNEYYFSDYDNILQEAVNQSSGLYEFNPEVILIFLDLRVKSPDLVYNFAGLSNDLKETRKAEVLGFVDSTLAELRKRTNAMVLFHAFEEPLYPAFGVYDYQVQDTQLNYVRELNRELMATVRNFKNCFLVDLNIIAARLGHKNFFDPRYWHIARAPFSKAAYKELAREYRKYFNAVSGKSKKCLILDCDNVLWGGILGEDGVGGIKIGRSFPGSAYWELQQAILDYFNTGVLLAICSKNNEEDVLEVLDKHPDMVLRREHFVSWRINWNNKAQNIREIVTDLNIGLDSVVFVDDSEAEIELVSRELPEVTTLLLKGDPVEFSESLRSCGYFDRLSITEEDRQKTHMYRADRLRKERLSREVNIEDYYKALEMELKICMADDFSISRIAQLTQKTNQFNLTTKRYTEADIQGFIESADHDVIFARLKDKFGDNGIIAVVILLYDRHDCVIDTFLMSCRVIGRGIENVILQACIKRARDRGCSMMKASFVPTQKNSQVRDFYARNSFTLVRDGVQRDFELTLSGDNLEIGTKYFKSVEVNLS